MVAGHWPGVKETYPNFFRVATTSGVGKILATPKDVPLMGIGAATASGMATGGSAAATSVVGSRDADGGDGQSAGVTGSGKAVAGSNKTEGGAAGAESAEVL